MLLARPYNHRSHTEYRAKSLIRQIEYKDKYGELPKPQRMIMNSDLIVRRSTK